MPAAQNRSNGMTSWRNGHRPITLAVLAMGGEGGGVLADWIVEVGEKPLDADCPDTPRSSASRPPRFPFPFPCASASRPPPFPAPLALPFPFFSLAAAPAAACSAASTRLRSSSRAASFS